MRQVIIVRKDLEMTPGKLSAQVSHASMAFISSMIRQKAEPAYKYRNYISFKFNPETGKKEPRMYKNLELSAFALEAFNNGLDSFTVKTVGELPDNTRFELCENEISSYLVPLELDKELYEDWFAGIFTKTICRAKNKNQLLKAVEVAKELGLEENKDYFLIKDSCLTELEPEEVDENGVGRTLTCIGFKPLPDEVAHTISKKYQLY